MPKWEYKFIECIYHLEDWYPAFDNGQEISHWKTQGNIATYSNALGEQGWEMVGCAASAAGTLTPPGAQGSSSSGPVAVLRTRARTATTPTESWCWGSFPAPTTSAAAGERSAPAFELRWTRLGGVLRNDLATVPTPSAFDDVRPAALRASQSAHNTCTMCSAACRTSCPLRRSSSARLKWMDRPSTRPAQRPH